ncbi:MAG: hypothetical protein IKF72_05290 [Kiritimatiellae bacterium]|nr:hypothetical protein [Kiritimatiellia bacterium]
MSRIKTLSACAAAALIFVSSTFGEDGYIESDGTCFVNTGYFIGPNTQIELDFQLTEIVSQCRLIGIKSPATNVTDPDNPRCEVYIGYDGNGVARFSLNGSKADGTRQAGNYYRAGLERHLIRIDYPASSGQFKVYTNGNLVDSRNLSAFHTSTAKYPLGLFGGNNTVYGSTPDSYWGASKMKVYRLKIYESGNLVRDFVPCIKGGVPGFKVTGPSMDTFITGVDIANVKYGGDIMEEMDDPYIATPNNDVVAGAEAGKSISLDTGYYVQPYSRIELDFAPLTPRWSKDDLYPNCNFMCAEGGGHLLYLLGRANLTETGCFYYKIGTHETNIKRISLANAYNIRRMVAFDSNTVYVTTAGFTNLMEHAAAGKEIVNPMNSYTLHLASHARATSGFAPMKIYGLKIYEHNVLVKDYRPIVTNGVPGLIDQLHPTDVRFSSTYLGGTRTNVVFEAGGNFTCTDGSNEAYLEFDGVSGHLINTGYVITPNSCIEADFSVYNTVYNGQQEFFKQELSNSNPNILARLYINSAYTLSYQFDDYSTYQTGVGINTQISAADNRRRQFKLDGYNSQVTIKCGNETLFDQPMARDHNNTGRQQVLKIGTNRAHMRLYSFKISESGTETRNFVPCLTNGVAGLYEQYTKVFYPLAGGKVRGLGTKGSGAFVTEPQPATLTSSGVANTTTLTCFAPSAQSYEWYEDGVLMPGETSDSLTLTWEKAKAKTGNHSHTYSVKPVYTVFNEKVKGDPVAATVEYTPFGMAVRIR